MIKIILLFLVLTTSALANWPHENISQAVFSSSIIDREPVEIITEADDSLGKIYFLLISVIEWVIPLRIAGFIPLRVQM